MVKQYVTSSTEPPPCVAGEWRNCRCVGKEREPLTVENVGDLTASHNAGYIIDHKPPQIFFLELHSAILSNSYYINLGLRGRFSHNFILIIN